MKQKKEESMEDLHCHRYEEGLTAIQEGIGKKGGTKRIEKVHERIGRLKEKYPSVHRYYEIDIKNDGKAVTEFIWKKTSNGSEHQGVYFIRTTFRTLDEKSVWDIYNSIREVEATFRTLKSDLKIRPIFHKKDESSEAHIYGGILAYTIVNSIRHQLKAKNIHHDWGTIVRRMNTQKIVTTSMKTESGHTIYVKKCSQPDKDVAEIYLLLNYNTRPFWQPSTYL